MAQKKIVLIDGNSLVYRAFFALPTTLRTACGQVTNAAYGFTSMLIRLIKDEKPDAVIVAFDKGKPHRVVRYKEYKAHRPETPNELRSQFPLVRDILGALQIPIVEMSGYEADDILATLAKRLKEKNQVLIVTGDRDMLQLVSSSVTVLATKRGITDTKRYDREGVIERFGVPPEKIADLIGLKGDSSDNIPGVPGVGEKTATKLLQQFGSLEEVLSHVDQIEPKRFREAIGKHGEIACLSKELAILENDVPVEIEIGQCELGNWDRSDVENVFLSLEFETLLDRFFAETEGKTSSGMTTLKFEVQEIVSMDQLNQLVDSLEETGSFSFDADMKGKYPADLKVGNLVITLEQKSKAGQSELTTYFIPLTSKTSKVPKEIVFQTLRQFFESSDYQAITYDAKTKILGLRNEGLFLKSLVFDTQIAAYLLEPGKKSSIQSLAREYIQTKMENQDEKELAVHRSYLSWQLKKELEKRMKEDGLLPLFEQVEMPLVQVLANMEWAGVGIDTKVLSSLGSEVDDSLRTLEVEIYDLAGEELNINSSQQLSKILFEKLGLKPEKKTKTGYSTDSSVLNKLIDHHPIVEKIIRYREFSKLKSTYIDALPKLVNTRTGRLHTTFSQVSTATGRLSSSNPNLQNIPVRTDLGLRVREAFVPARETDEFLVADYSQIELRILAHLSGSKNLLQAFAEGEDIHRSTAAEVFGVDPQAVDQEMRRRAKAVNFGIVYGISPFGLSEQLGIDKEEAREYIDKYFERYKEVRKFTDKTIADVYEKGFVETVMGRRRYIPELKSGNYRIRSLGERLAINTRIQGSAADIIKLAMIELDKELSAQGLQTKMILQVHDELVFEVPPLEREIVFSLVEEKMENAYPLGSHLKIDTALGANWREAK